MKIADLESLRQKLVTLESLHTNAALEAADARAIIEPIINSDDLRAAKRLSMPRVDRSGFCIEWNGRMCFLGATRTFHLLECLARRPNRFVSHAQLLSEVWNGHIKEVETIRSVVRHLRKKLRAAKMHDLADAIVGAGQAYRLVLNQSR